MRRPDEWGRLALNIARYTDPQHDDMIWDAISFHNRTRLVEISLRLVAQWNVRDILSSIVSPFLLRHPGLTFQQDNNQLHIEFVAMNCLQACPTLLCPARCPYLSQMEHMCDIIWWQFQPSRNIDLSVQLLKTVWPENPQNTIQ